ncbi:hypothetical protein SDC9_67558 [bioreactor metagenome]|uniref:Uncharacterized protein n=1 Tax=bioreactor metagenome TaxID=1076179 RepID=A0A644XY36_9ZZZZ
MLYFNWFANSFITDSVGAAFAGQAFIEQYFCPCDFFSAVHRCHLEIFTVFSNADNAFQPLCLDFVDVHHACAGNADDQHLLTFDAPVLDELVEAVGIAGFQKHCGLFIFFRIRYQVFAEISGAESVVDESVQFFRLAEIGRCIVVEHLALLPGDDAGDLLCRQ